MAGLAHLDMKMELSDQRRNKTTWDVYRISRQLIIGANVSDGSSFQQPNLKLLSQEDVVASYSSWWARIEDVVAMSVKEEKQLGEFSINLLSGEMLKLEAVVVPKQQPADLEEFQTRFVAALNALMGNVNNTGNKTLVMTRHYNDGQAQHVTIKGPLNFVTRRLETTEPGRQVVILDVTEGANIGKELKVAISVPLVDEEQELKGPWATSLYYSEKHGAPLHIPYKDDRLIISVTEE